MVHSEVPRLYKTEGEDAYESAAIRLRHDTWRPMFRLADFHATTTRTKGSETSISPNIDERNCMLIDHNNVGKVQAYL